jgi:MFS family permease
VSEQPPHPLYPRRFLVLALVWLANFVFWLSWFVQGPLLESYWVAHQHVSFGSAEYLLSGVDIASIVTALLFGHFFDRFGPKRATALCLLVILIGFGLRPLAVDSFPFMLVLTVVAGLGLPIIVAPPPVIAQWFGRQRMTVPLMVALSAFVLGQAGGLLLGARMVAALGAAWTFGVLSIAIAVVLLAWLLLVPSAPPTPAGPRPERPAPLRQALRTVLAAPGSWRSFALGGVYAAVIVFSGSFLPGVLSNSLKLSPAGGGEGAAIVPAAAFVGVFCFAWLVRRTGAPGRFGTITATGQLLAWLVFALLWFAGDLGLAAAFALLAVFGFCFQACFGLGLNRIEHAPGITADTVGVAAGFYFTGVSIGGWLLPTVLAQIVDAAGPAAGFVGLAVLFVAGAALWATAPSRAAVAEPETAMTTG